ncbi:hypothetical protein BDU57DRAFT_539332 [Ampelomyces quisqualis]|uniref:Succinate dehydrogenase assembly factor 4, mitochondrial n=1 Tax=Ampelomyces quisqualis TaxID=50730 RepID=A0A6A5QP29_AMPQU|nr:hypothetical protein BDU57DRAFT_539332 [Ampelomyces quisqualis]
MSFQRLPRLLSRRAFSTSLRHPTSFKTGPAPPRLPREEQELFEKLQKASTGAFSTPSATTPPPNSTPPATSPAPQINQSPHAHAEEGVQVRFESGKEIPKGEEVHPNMRRGAPPEFQGDTNPKTGEVGGPKNEPLRWGVGGDWSYNGRVTDF